MCRQVTSSETRFTKNYLADALLQSVCEITQDEKESSMDPNLRISVFSASFFCNESHSSFICYGQVSH